MRTVLSILIAVSVAGLGWCADSTADDARADDTLAHHYPIDIVFTEIRLSQEGVSAVDSAGSEWHYDFEQELFVSGPLEVDLEPYRSGAERADDIPIRERCTEERRIKPFERTSITIGYDEFVDGDVVVLGRVTVKGWVKGSVRSIKKRVLVTESGRVDGNIEAPEVVIREGGQVFGEIIEEVSPLEFTDFAAPFSANGLIVAIVFTAFLLFCAFIAISLMPRQVDSFYRCTVAHKTRTYLLGFLFLTLMPVLVVLVMITIVGIILVPLLPLLYLAAIVLGVISFGNVIGRQFSIRFLGGEKNLLSQSVVGILFLMSLWLITAILLGSSDPVSEGFGIFFLVVAILITSFPIASGIGAALLTRFGFREYVSWKDRVKGDIGPGPGAPAPAPPPIPEPPSLSNPSKPVPPDNAT